MKSFISEATRSVQGSLMSPRSPTDASTSVLSPPPHHHWSLVAGPVGPMAAAPVLPEGPGTPVGPVAAPSAQSLRRMQLLELRQVPSYSEAQSQLGKPLSSLLFATLNKRERQLLGLEPVLRGKDRLTPSVTQLLSAPGRLQRCTADAQVQADAREMDPVRARTQQKPLIASRHDRARQHVAILKLIQQSRANKKEEVEAKASTLTVAQSIENTFGKGYARWYQEMSSKDSSNKNKKVERGKQRKVLKSAGDPIQYTRRGKCKVCRELADLNAPPNSLVSSVSHPRKKGPRKPRKQNIGRKTTSFPKKYGIGPAPTSREKIEDWLRKNLVARYVHTKNYLSQELANADAETLPVSTLYIPTQSHMSRIQSSRLGKGNTYKNGNNSEYTKNLPPLYCHNIYPEKRQVQGFTRASIKLH